MIPFSPLLLAQGRIKAIELQAVARHLVRLHVAQPCVVKAVIPGMEAPHPRRIIAQHGHHAVDHRLALRTVVHVLHALEQAVELGVLVVRLVFTAVFRSRIRPVQQEQEILRIGIVGIPAQEKHLRVALPHLFLEAVPVTGTDVQLHANALELPAIPVKARLVLWSTYGGIQVQHQRLPRPHIAATRVAGFGEQALCHIDRTALHRIVAAIALIDQRIDSFGTIAKSEYPGRYRPLPRTTTTICKDRYVFIKIDCNGNRLAQLFRALTLDRITTAATDHRIQPVEGKVIARRRD